jgi:hypothetical protein
MAGEAHAAGQFLLEQQTLNKLKTLIYWAIIIILMVKVKGKIVPVLK